MRAENLYPIQVQADNINAAESNALIMCQVFDVMSETGIYNALSKAYLHVIAWDKNGIEIYQYDNRK